MDALRRMIREAEVEFAAATRLKALRDAERTVLAERGSRP